MERLAIVNIGQLVTMAGPAQPRAGAAMQELAIIENAMVLCKNGQIAAVGPQDEMVGYIVGAKVFDAEGQVVIPGLIDAHTHPVFAGTRENEYELRIMGKTYQEIAAGGGGIRSTVRRTRALNSADLLAESRRHTDLLLAHGTTTAEAKSGYGLSLEDELKSLRIIDQINQEKGIELVPTFLGAHEVPDEYRADRSAYIELILNEMIPAVTQTGLAKFCDIFCEGHVFSIEESRRLLAAAKAAGLGIRMHADQLTRGGGAQLAAELGAVTADHLEQIDADGIAALKAAGVIAVLLPGSVFHLGLKHYPPARQMIDAGLVIVLASDFNPGSSPTPSLPMTMSIACTQMRMTPAECLTACTINAAYSLGLGDRLGSLEIGKQADMAIFACADYRQIPYFFGANLLQTVIKRGKIVLRRS